MRPIATCSFAVVALVLAVTASRTAISSGQNGSLVRLQSATPGTPQTGHSNLSGTSTSGQFVGGGAGLTGLNASNISSGTLSANRLPVPLTLTGTGDIVSASTSSTNSSDAAVRGHVTATTGEAIGGLFTSTSSLGTAVKGICTAVGGSSTGGSFSSQSTSGTGVRGASNGKGVVGEGRTYGGYFMSLSVDGVGSYGMTTATTGIGVFGENTAPTGETYGVRGISRSATGYGVNGHTTSTTGLNAGGLFQSDSTSGFGLYAYDSSSSGTIYGVYGAANVAAGGYAVFAEGDLGASGVKPFRIDHPLDPEHKYLLHYASESPYPQNFYSGNTVTDASGYAWIELPDYFAEVNANFKYQLTVVSKDFVQAVVAEEIKENRFQIRTSAPSTKVSWRIEADRNDRYVQFKKPMDVQDKIGREKGTYQHPEFYGQPEEKGLTYPLRSRKTTGGTRTP